MHDVTPLLPRKPVPKLAVPLAGGGRFELAAEKAEKFILLDFFRGLHCPQCKNHLTDLEAKLPEFAKRGVTVLTLSSDDKARAEQMKKDWALANLRVGYGLPLAEARRWGLYISTGRGKTSIGVDEPALFSEPGIFLVRPDGTLYFSIVQTMPFIRPSLGPMLTALDFVIEKNYPARGEVENLPSAAA